MLPGLAVPGCCLVSLPFRCQILRPHPVHVTNVRSIVNIWSKHANAFGAYLGAPELIIGLAQHGLADPVGGRAAIGDFVGGRAAGDEEAVPART